MSQVITNAFEQYWQSSLATEQPVVLDEFILADIPNLDITAPIDQDTGLPPESQIVHRQNVDQRGRINNNAVAYTIVMDTTVGDFSFNAMYLRNKQNGVIGMIVYKGRETKLKTDQTTGQTGNSLVKSMLMGYDQAAEATLTNVDAGTWQIDYAARLRGQDEDLRQLASQLYGHHTFIGDGFKVVQQDGGHQVTQGVAIVGGLRVELKAPEVIHPGTKPIGVWVDVHRAGSLLSEHQNHFTIITSVADLADHVDSNGYQHYVAKLATVQVDNTVVDGRGVTRDGETSIPESITLLEQADAKLTITSWEALRRSYAEAGYNVIGTFRDGFTLNSATDVGLNEADGKGYSGAGPFPQTVAKGTTPGAGFTDRSSSLLKVALASNEGASLIGSSVGRAIEDRMADTIKVIDYKTLGRTYPEAIAACTAYAKTKQQSGKAVKVSFENCDALITTTVGFVLDFPVIWDQCKTQIKGDGVIGTLLKCAAPGIWLRDFNLKGIGAEDNTRLLWMSGAPAFRIQNGNVSDGKEGWWCDGGSYSGNIDGFNVGNNHGRGIYCDVVTSAEHSWRDVYVGLSAAYIDDSTIGIEMYSSAATDSGGYHWYNVLVVNNTAEGAAAGKGVYLNGSNAQGITPIHWVGGGADGFVKDNGKIGVKIRNWAQVKCNNVWASNCEIDSADSPQWIGGNCATGFTLKGTIKDPVFIGPRCAEATAGAYLLDAALVITGFIREYGTITSKLTDNLDKWIYFTRQLLDVTTSLTNDTYTAERLKDQTGTVKFYRRINSVGENVWLRSAFVDHTVMRQNGQLYVPGGIAPFTGIHQMRSAQEIEVGKVAIFVNAEQITDEIVVQAAEENSPEQTITLVTEGEVRLCDQDDSLAFAGIVVESQSMGDYHLVTVAAVGDNSTPQLDCVDVDGEFAIGDLLSTSATGLLKRYEGSDLRIPCLRVKGIRSGKAYGYFI